MSRPLPFLLVLHSHWPLCCHFTSCMSLQVSVDDNMKLTVEFNNQGNTPKTVSALVEVAAIHYTGVFISPVMSSNLTVTVPANESEPRKRTEWLMFYMKACVHGLMCVCVCVAATLQNFTLAADSLKSLESESSLEVLVTGDAEGQPVSAKLVIEPKPPQLIMMVHTHTHTVAD